ncbi:hypothetical protein RHGRI_026223 [Rhododendron griersonianum]|uniref:Retrotransposon Copia-like N-terminal domain-containing protein n=1 Tax=Rhododendron griersonianum TaxID=479676 RepID=A0AAV6ITE0_9ERIC|nr:hypothetical protein RHGRI_026223 [Rhododendron griersonianum]
MGGQSEINLSPRLSSVLLNGLNYVPWSRVVALALGGKSLFGHVDGTKAAPKTDNEKYGEWKSENQYTMSLLLNSMEPKIAEIFTFAESAKELWESVRDLYGHQNNAARIYQLQQNINNCKQGDRSFVEYLGELKSMWDELGLYRPPTTNLATLQQRAEQDKVFQLLAHIKPDFENLRGQILMGSGVPSFSSVCASIQQEETRRMAMNIEPKSTVIQSEASALMNPTGNPLEGECLDDFIPIPIVDTNPIDSPQGDASPETSTVAPPVEVSSPDEVAPSIYLPPQRRSSRGSMKEEKNLLSA